MTTEFKFELDEHVTTEREITNAFDTRRAPRIFNIASRTQSGGGNTYKLVAVPDGSCVTEFSESNIIPVKNIRKRLVKEVTKLLIYYTEMEYK